MRITCLCLFLFLFASCSKEENSYFIRSFVGGSDSLSSVLIKAQLYNAYPSSKRTNIFRDDFEDNRNEWVIPSNGQIGNGYYISYGNNQLTTKSVAIEESKDFEVEVRIGFRDAAVSAGNGFIWCYNNQEKTYTGVFDIVNPDNINEKAVSIYSNKNSTSSINYFILPIQDYNMDGINWGTYTMRKVSSKLLLFINGNKVSEKNYLSTNGIEIGINDISGLWIDYINIDYIK